MGCINGKQLLNEEDLNYIARNTAMDKDAVEVRTFLGLLRITDNLLVILQRQYQNFLKKHPDGQISRKSFHAMMKECYPGTDTEKLERHIFRMYDTNKVCHILSTVEMAVLCILRPMNLFFLFQDGHIDFREFMIVLYIMSNGTPQDNLKQIFKVFDINNDGFISLKELQRIVKDLFHLINEENADEASQELLAQSGNILSGFEPNGIFFV